MVDNGKLPSRHNDKKQDNRTLEEINEDLRKEIEELKKASPQGEGNLRDRNLSDRMDLRSDARIKVISLCPHTLCLTGKKGERAFTFKKFGEVKRIRYEDLSYVIENHRAFLEDGVFMILDADVIRMHALDEFYGNILTKDNFDKILSGNFSDAVKLVENANSRQQHYIAEMFVRKIIDGEKISLDFIDKIARITGEDIKEIADTSIHNRKVYKKAAEGNAI